MSYVLPMVGMGPFGNVLLIMVTVLPMGDVLLTSVVLPIVVVLTMVLPIVRWCSCTARYDSDDCCSSRRRSAHGRDAETWLMVDVIPVVVPSMVGLIPVVVPSMVGLLPVVVVLQLTGMLPMVVVIPMVVA